jgi:indole-3-glycerol phosphate synthase
LSVLQRILIVKQREVAAASAAVPLQVVREQAQAAPPPRCFRAALEAADGLALIAEVKKASPSKGLIRPDFDPADIARAYARAGAHALSVLTDAEHFQGSLDNLALAREASGLPCLRKDFIYDPYQVYEARANGADAILLIVAMLPPSELEDLSGLAKYLGMDVLVEVHSEAEVDIALGMKADVIGVNNRDLGDFTTSISVSETLLPLIRRHALPVSESALESRADLDRVQAAGAKAVLIGTTFCAAPDIEAKVREVMGW